MYSTTTNSFFLSVSFDRFRNLCIDGGHDICAEMYNKNILAPLRLFPDKVGLSSPRPQKLTSTALHACKISLSLRQFLENSQVGPDAARRLVYEFAENVITIFWCLSCVPLLHPFTHVKTERDLSQRDI